MKEALKLALELLAVGTFHSPDLQAKRTDVIEQGLEALAQPEQEPVAWMYESVCGNDFATRHCAPDYAKNIRPLYTTPPPIGFAVMQKPWVGLTDEEIELLNDCGDTDSYKFARAIEAKLRSKNENRMG